MITGASARLGYVHRGIEKGVESMNWTQGLYLMERICGICSHIHSLAYCQGIETLTQVEIPARHGPFARLLQNLNEFTVICCGGVSLRMRPGLIPFLCTPGVIVKLSWIYLRQ